MKVNTDKNIIFVSFFHCDKALAMIKKPSRYINNQITKFCIVKIYLFNINIYRFKIEINKIILRINNFKMKTLGKHKN